MTEPITHTLTIEKRGTRLDKEVSEQVDELSRAQVQRLIKDDLVLVNGQSSRASYRVDLDDVITVTIPAVIDIGIVGEDIPLDIRYEDDDCLVINKPAKMVAHPSIGHETGTLVHAVLGYCPEVLGVGGIQRPGIVHRLDKATSGLIVVAKNDNALWYLQKQFKERTVDKRYLALVFGQVDPPQALIDAPLGRERNERKKMGVVTDPKLRSRPSQTEYRTITTYDAFTLLECKPLTGRTHQIRVHMAYVNHPLVGDLVYGRRKSNQPYRTVQRHFLHAARLTFRRPSDGEEVIVNAELPPELQGIIDDLDQQ